MILAIFSLLAHKSEKLSPREPINTRIIPRVIVPKVDPLPVHIDMEWLGCTMTSDNAGIITRDSVIESNRLSL